MELGYTSREGNAFNTLTIRHILENPKYKGWYCGNRARVWITGQSEISCWMKASG